MSRHFLDSNIFLYAVGGEHPLREPCRKILQQTKENRVRVITSVEVVQEVLHVLRRKGRDAEAITLARSIIEIFPDLLPITSDEIDSACELIEAHSQLTTRDALHAATMQTHGLVSIISADQHFDKINWLRRIDPASNQIANS